MSAAITQQNEMEGRRLAPSCGAQVLEDLTFLERHHRRFAALGRFKLCGTTLLS